ncbi:MAG: hypothetical protein ACRD1X_10210 [Vicinamibacteria bacterium]
MAKRMKKRKHGLGAKAHRMSSADLLTRQYVEMALWSSTDDEGIPLEENYDISHIAVEALKQMDKDVHAFAEENDGLITKAGLEDDDVGHNFWLTRNRHGAGFWDLDIPRAISKKLTDAAHAYGEQSLYVGDDGFLYIN